MNRISNKTKENRGYGKGEGKNYMLITKLIANTVFKLNCTHN